MASAEADIFDFVQNLKIRTVGTMVSYLLLFVVLAIVAASQLTIRQVDHLGMYWRQFDTGAAAKGQVLHNLRAAIGYGGMIHDFKNFVLRRDHPRIVRIHAKLREVNVALAVYRAHGVNEAEERALAELEETVGRYASAVSIAEKMASVGATSREIDAAVKIDDRPALAALAVLGSEIEAARNASASTVYTAVARVEEFIFAAQLAIGALLGLLIVSFLWFTRTRLIKPLAELERTMEALAGGDVAVDIPALERNDEIGAMARTVLVFRENAIARNLAEDALREREQRLKAHVTELRAAKHQYEAQGKQLAALVEDIAIARDDAEAANRAKSEFLTLMSHELRTPLNAIIGFSEIIKGEMFGPVGTPRYRDYAKDVHDSGQHLLGLINDILDLSKIEAGQLELDEEDVDVAEVIQSCLRLVRERARNGGVGLVTEIAEELPALRFDERKLKQILINLLSNAVKFTPDGGEVTIKAWFKADSGYVFQIIDTGIGIAIEDIPKALTSFGQIDSKLARKYEGTGLGLPLTKSLIEMSAGSMDLQSEAGEGTTVTVRFSPERAIASPADAPGAPEPVRAAK
jgi:signal transduction histidine kinase